MTDSDEIFDELELQEHGDEDEPAWFVAYRGQVMADLLWNTVESSDPSVPEHGGHWMFSPKWGGAGSEQPWPEVGGKDQAEAAIARAKEVVAGHLAETTE